MERVLITGAAGGIGKGLRGLLKGVYGELRLSDRVDIGAVGAGESFVKADLANAAEVEKAVAGIDGIVHLGGVAVEGDWDSILNSNIVGCYNLFEAARRAGVKRVVFATTNHVIGFHRRTHRFGSDAQVRPDSRYGVSKAFGEALAALYADKYGLRILCIRIGNYADAPADHRRLSIWVKPEDLAQLVRIGLEHPELHYEIVYGISDNERAWWDNSVAYRLGYRPSGRAEEHAAAAMAADAKLPRDPLAALFQGGPFCSAEFAGDPDRIK